MLNTNNIYRSSELWKLIPGETEYMISNMGNVMSLKRGKMKLIKRQDLSNWYRYNQLIHK
jgi:hypothetical protein